MQALGPRTAASAADLWSSSSGLGGERVAPAAAVSRSEAAPCGCASLRWPSLFACELALANASRKLRIGGAYRDRTDDLMLAKQPLSQLS